MKPTLRQVTLSLHRAELHSARFWYEYARENLGAANKYKNRELKARALTFCAETRRRLKNAIANTNAALGRTV